MQVMTDLVVLTILALLTSFGSFVLIYYIFTGNLAWRKRKTETVESKAETPIQVSESEVSPSDPFEAATTELKFLLDELGYTVWSVGRGDGYKVGLRWGVTLSWPAEEPSIREKEVAQTKEVNARVAEKHGLKAFMNGPEFAAGGAIVMYCGFETELMRKIMEKATAAKKPAYAIMAEDSEIKELLAKQ